MDRPGASRALWRWVGLAVASGAVLLLSACSEGDEPEVQTPPLTLDTVSVVATGTGDPVDLRWVPEAGQSSHIDVSIGVDTTVELEDLVQEATIGPATVGFAAVVVEVGADGITTEYRITTAGVTEDGDQGLDSALERLVGTTIVDKVTAKGVPIARTIEPAEPLGAAETAQLDRFVAQLAFVFAPLPSEPVAEGATWTYARTAEVQGVLWTRATTFELNEVDGTSVSLSVDLAEYAEFQEVDASGPTNLEGTIVGDGALTGDLASLTTRAYSSSTHLEAAIFTGDDRSGRTANQTDAALTSVDSDS